MDELLEALMMLLGLSSRYWEDLMLAFIGGNLQPVGLSILIQRYAIGSIFKFKRLYYGYSTVYKTKINVSIEHDWIVGGRKRRQNVNVYCLFDFGKSENNFQDQLSQFSSGPSSWTTFWSLFHPFPKFSRPNKHSSYNRKPKSAR